MKKEFLCFFIAFLLLIAKGFASQTEAVFSAADRERIQVIIDGRLVNEIPQRQVYVQDRPGKHTIEIKVFNYWGRLQFIHNDRILVKPNSRNIFLLQVHAYGNTRLVQQTKTFPARAVPAKAPKPIKHHVPMVAHIITGEILQQKNTAPAETAALPC